MILYDIYVYTFLKVNEVKLILEKYIWEITFFARRKAYVRKIFATTSQFAFGFRLKILYTKVKFKFEC